MSGQFPYKPAVAAVFFTGILALLSFLMSQHVRGQTIKPDGVCFVRVCGDGHLPRHRNQVVRRIRAFIIPGHDPTGAGHPFAQHIGIILTGPRMEYHAIAGCGWKSAPRQSSRLLVRTVECDGGGVGL